MKSSISGPFEPGAIGPLALRNRFVRSATMEGLADASGRPQDALIALMDKIAAGGAGLVITGHVFVSLDGRMSLNQCGIHEDALVDAFRPVADAIRSNGARSCMQLSHAGCYSLSSGDTPPPCVSAGVEGLPAGAELNGEGIENLIVAFVSAAERAKEAGFDSVQLHAAHGYLLSQFLSPLYNRRTDRYGGSVENRARAVAEIVSAIKSVSPDLPVLVKLNSTDAQAGGMTLADALETAAILEKSGADAIEVSGGLLSSKETGPSRTGVRPGAGEAYFREAAGEIRKKLGIPVLLVGGVRTIEAADAALAGGFADYISLSRPLVHEPGLVNRWKSGDRAPSRCLSDNRCFRPLFVGRSMKCFNRDEKKGQEA